MRTTVDIDDSILAAAKAIARDEAASLGTVLSRLARGGLDSGRVAIEAIDTTGFPLFGARADAPPITLAIVNEHRDDD